MIITCASMRNSVGLTRSDQTRRARSAVLKAVGRAEATSFPGIAARDHSVRPRPVLAIERL